MTTTKKAPIGALQTIAIDKIRPNPFQPRTEFDAAEIKKLAASLEANGLLQPITVRVVDDGYELLAGERRTRAAESIGWTTIPAIVRTFSDAEMAVLGLVENLQRADLSPLDEAEGLKRLADELGWSQAKIAEETGIPRSTVGDRLRALELPDAWLALLRKGEIQFSHAPVIHKYRDFPAAAHARVIEDACDDLDWSDAKESGNPISVDAFTHLLAREFGTEMHPLSELAPGYDGPVVVHKTWRDDKPRKYAADREKWQPLLEAKRAAEEKRARATSKASGNSKSDRSQAKFEAEQKRNREKAAQLTRTREAQIAALIELAPPTWNVQLWRAFVAALAEAEGYTSMIATYAQIAPGEKPTNDYNKMAKALRAYTAQADAPALMRLALRIILAREVSQYNLTKKPTHLAAFAEAMGTTLDALTPTPKVPAQPAGELLSVFTVGRLGKSLVKKSLDKWPNDLLAYQVKYAREQLAKFDDVGHFPLTNPNHRTREEAFLHGIDRNTVVADLALLTTAAAARGLEIEVPVRVTDEAVQAIRAATEHDEADGAGSGDEEFENGESYDLVAIEDIEEAEA